MARIGISIEKTISFRGAAQPFSNTYYYNAPNPVDAAQCDSAIGLLESAEKAIHSSAVTFTRGRAWTAGGTKEENSMLVDKPLSGTGNAGASTTMDRERAFLVRIRAGNDSLGRPVYLRKYWHLDASAIAGTTINNQQQQNIAQLSTAQRASLAGAYDQLKTITPVGLSGNWTLESEKGRQITGATIAHPYIEHHQLGDQWRG